MRQAPEERAPVKESDLPRAARARRGRECRRIAEEVSFVAVTQQCNTTSSMGRLTLNIVLSFAQLERKVTSERIRDKIAASKRKDWMGSVTPLGYEVNDRKLVIPPVEAKIVRAIYAQYPEPGSVRLLNQNRSMPSLQSDLRRRDRVQEHPLSGPA